MEILKLAQFAAFPPCHRRLPALQLPPSDSAEDALLPARPPRGGCPHVLGHAEVPTWTRTASGLASPGWLGDGISREERNRRKNCGTESIALSGQN